MEEVREVLVGELTEEPADIDVVVASVDDVVVDPDIVRKDDTCAVLVLLTSQSVYGISP